MIDHLKGIQSHRAQQDISTWEKTMGHLKSMFIGALLIIAYVIASDNDYRDAYAAHLEKEDRVRAACKRMGKEPVRDNDNKLVCMDSAPAIALARPVK